MKFIVFIFLLFSIKANSQILLKKQKTIEFEGAKFQNTQIEIDSSCIYYFNKEREFFSINGFIEDSLVINREIPLNKLYTIKNKGYQIHPVVRKNNLYLFVGQYLYHYEMDFENNLLAFVDRLRINQSYDHFTKSQNKIYAYTLNPLSKSLSNGEVMDFDISTNKINYSPIKLDFPVASTIGPNNYFDPLYSEGNSYLISEVAHYKISIFKNKVFVDSIYLDNDSLFKKISLQDSTKYSRLQKYHLDLTEITTTNSNLREKCGHIWSVFYINDSTVLARISNPDMKAKFVMFDHLWKKTNQGWTLERVVELNPYTKNYEEFWPYYSLYNRLYKWNSELFFFHFANCNYNNDKKFETATYFDPKQDLNSICTVLWQFGLN